MFLSKLRGYVKGNIDGYREVFSDSSKGGGK